MSTNSSYKARFRNIVIGLAVLLLTLGGFSYFFGQGSNSGAIQLQERVFFKLKNSLDVTEHGHSAGKVAENLIQLTRTFTWSDENGQTKATASVALISWGTEITVYDGSGNKVGYIEEHVFSSWLGMKTWTKYSIKDGNGREIAISDKTEFMGTNFTLKAPDGSTIAELDRPWINWMGDHWNVTIKQPGVIDERVLVMIGAFKTAADRDKSHSGSDSGSNGSSGKKK